tara:strand:- start:125 stop:667 length:543 start_codon:yes stop_codon:yes gene_type:complete
MLSSPSNSQQLKLESITDYDALSLLKQNQEPIGQKCIEYLGEPRNQGKSFKKGWQGEVIAFNKLARLGYDVRFEKPCNYDLTIHGEKGITRIQVKTFIDDSNHRIGKDYYYQRVNLHKGGGNSDGKTKTPYLLTDFDFLAAVDIETEEVFLVSIRDLESSSTPGSTKRGVTKKSIINYKI